MPHQSDATIATLGLQTTGIGSWVRVKNVGNLAWVDRFNNARYEIPAGSEILAPYEAIMLWLGDPDARDIDPRRRYRTEEFRRIRVRCGAYDDELAWEQNRPHLEVFTTNGERITTVVDDPDLSSPLLQPTGGVLGDDAIAQLTERVRVLTEQLNSVQQFQQAPAPATPTTLQSTVDAPSQDAPSPFNDATSGGAQVPEGAPSPETPADLPVDEPTPVGATKDDPTPTPDDEATTSSSGGNIVIDTPSKPRVKR